MNAHLETLLRRYAGWAATALLVIAIFTSLIAAKIIFPLILFVTALALAMFRYWDDLKTFDVWALDEWIRTRHDSIGIRDWHSPYQAAELYCTPVVVKARNEAAAEMNTIMMELIRDPEHSAPSFDEHFMTRAGRLGPESGAGRNHTHYDAAQARFNHCNAVLSRELRARLARGHLLAKGLLMQHDVALSERIIPTSRWRVMNLDIAKGYASGHGWSYTGLVIGKKPVDAKIAKPPRPQKAR